MTALDVIDRLVGLGFTGDQMAAIVKVLREYEASLESKRSDAAVRQQRYRERHKDRNGDDIVTREINVPVTPVAPVDPSTMPLLDMLETLRQAEAAQVVRQAQVPTEEQNGAQGSQNLEAEEA